MANLYFKYGAMGASKSAEAIMTAYNYELSGRKVLLAKPAVDTRWCENAVVSRAGNMKRPCSIIKKDDDIEQMAKAFISENGSLDCVIIDECQFLTKQQVYQLGIIVDYMSIPVMCYGLKNSAIDGEIFEGSLALLYSANNIEEIRTLCAFCTKKAIMNLRIVNKKPIRTGDVVLIGDTKKDGNEYYVPTCRKHYYNPPDNI